MNKVLQFSLLLILVGCNQDSPNVKQIGNMQYFIENAVIGDEDVLMSIYS